MATIALRPKSAGYEAFTASTGSGYACVNETESDGDSTYVYLSGALTYLPPSSYAFYQLDVSALPNKIKINSAIVHVVAKTVNSTDVGSISASVGLGDAPTSSSIKGLNYGSTHTLGTAYTDYSDEVVPANPTTSTSETTYELSTGLFVALQGTVHKNSTKASKSYLRVTQIYVVLDYDEVIEPPVISISTPDKMVISDEEGFTVSTTSFTCDQDLTEWEARATLTGASTGHGVGLLVESGTNLSLGVSANVVVEYTELTNGDGTYVINIYGKNSAGMWSDE